MFRFPASPASSVAAASTALRPENVPWPPCTAHAASRQTSSGPEVPNVTETFGSTAFLASAVAASELAIEAPKVELTTLKDAFGKDLRGIRPYS
eukprot:s899_g11.t1